MNIKELRESLNLSQEEFGKSIGLSKSGISNIENGKRKLSKRNELLIEAMFGRYIEQIDLSLVSTDDLIAELKRRCSS